MRIQKWEEACSDQISYVSSGKKALRESGRALWAI